MQAATGDVVFVCTSLTQRNDVNLMIANLKYAGIPSFAFYSTYVVVEKPFPEPDAEDPRESHFFTYGSYPSHERIYVHYARLCSFVKSDDAFLSAYVERLPEDVRHRFSKCVEYCKLIDKDRLNQEALRVRGLANARATAAVEEMSSYGSHGWNMSLTSVVTYMRVKYSLIVVREELRTAIRKYLDGMAFRTPIDAEKIVVGFPYRNDVWWHSESFPDEAAVFREWRTEMQGMHAYVVRAIGEQEKSTAVEELTRRVANVSVE